MSKWFWIGTAIFGVLMIISCQCGEAYPAVWATIGAFACGVMAKRIDA